MSDQVFFPVIDLHNDTVLKCIIDFRRISKSKKRHVVSSKGHCDVPRLREGRVMAGVFALCPTKHPLLMSVFSKTWLRVIGKGGNGLMQVKDLEDFAKAKEAGTVGAVMGFEGSGGLDPALERLEHYRGLGLRQLNITWADKNKFGTGAKFKGEQWPTGLTDLGRDLVVKAQGLGITIDVSHLNDPSFWDVVEVAKRPVIASHSNARSICPHPRNLADEQIEAIRECRGVIGINFYRKFLDPGYRQGKADVSLDQVKAHVDHVANIASIDTVAIGSDYDGATVPEVLSDCTKFPGLFSFLLENGYSVQDCRKISHENALRVFKATW